MAKAAGTAKGKGGSSKAAFANPITSQAEELKYKTKYRELKAKVGEVEEDNTKLQLKILKSKKNIQRLRIERAILYDRLQSNTTPTNPYALNLSHLAALATNPTSSTAPPTILDPPTYPLLDPNAPTSFIAELDERKRLAILRNVDQFGERAVAGIAGEEERTVRGVSPVAGPSGHSNGAGVVVPNQGMEIDRRI